MEDIRITEFNKLESNEKLKILNQYGLELKTTDDKRLIFRKIKKQPRRRDCID